MSKPIHWAEKVREDGAMSALCFSSPRALDLRVASWTIVDRQVTCPRCKPLRAAARTARAEAIEEAAGVADHMAVEEDVLAEHYRLLNASRSGEQQENAMTRSAACRHVAGAIRALAERKEDGR